MLLLKAFGVFMIAAGIFHFVKPKVYFPFMPDWFPKPLANYAAGAVEILLGAGLLLSDYQKPAALLSAILMLIFLPLHVRDLMRPRPLIGPKWVAVIRLVFQFVLIWWLYAWWQEL